MSAGPVVQAFSGHTIGAHSIDNPVNVTDGSTLTFMVRTPDVGVYIGGQNMSDQAALGGSGNPTAVGYKLTANKEYTFTVSGQVQTGAVGDTFTVFLYNSTLATVSYDIITTTR